jgi:hypothetical protein
MLERILFESALMNWSKNFQFIMILTFLTFLGHEKFAGDHACDCLFPNLDPNERFAFQLFCLGGIGMVGSDLGEKNWF